MTNTDLAYHLKDIRHFYGRTKVLDIDDLKIKNGSITGLIGPNGSGKSTLLKLLAFTRKPSQGEIFYKGRPEVPFSSAIRSKVTLLTQKPYLLKRTVFDNIAYGLVIRKDKKNLVHPVNKALLTVGLDYQDFAARKWHELSGGEAQRVAMAARLILKPDVLLLDEPIASVDTESASLIRDASLKARDQWGATLVIASHDLQWLYSISDSQLSIFNGTIFSTGIENMITGPFLSPDERSDKEICIKKVGDGQVIRLETPSSKPGTAAIIRKKHICLSLEKQLDTQRFNQLSGHVVSLLLEKKSNHIIAAVAVHDLSFVIQLTPEQIRSLDLFPGKKVVLKFRETDVEWV